MVHRILEVEAKEDCVVEAIFYNGDVVRYDVKALFSVLPQFEVFMDQKELFGTVQVDTGGLGISWNDKLDLAAEAIWENGVHLEIQRKMDLNHLMAYRLLLAREKAGMTQKDLAEKTGIYQADISKIERGLGNPSLLTLKRLADGLNMDLKIDFVFRDKES